MGSTILVIHNEPSLRKLLRLRLEKVGLAVREVNDVRQSLNEFAVVADDVAAVVSGVRMNGLSGVELLAGVRDICPDIPVFFFSSHPLSDDSTLPPGVQIFVKPHELNDLIQAVRDCIPVGIESAEPR